MTNSPIAGTKTSMKPAITPGIESGSVTWKKVDERPPPEVGRGLEQALVELHEVGVERQDHERQVGVDDAEIDGEGRLQHHQRLVDDPGPEQEVVDHPVRAQEPLPGVDPQQERRPERQDDQRQQDRAPRLRRLRAM